MARKLKGYKILISYETTEGKRVKRWVTRLELALISPVINITIE
jgi:hypothetical protein